MNYANDTSQAALERSSQDAYDVIRLTRSKAAVWTVDDVARLIEFKKNYIFRRGCFAPSRMLQLLLLPLCLPYFCHHAIRLQKDRATAVSTSKKTGEI